MKDPMCKRPTFHINRDIALSSTKFLKGVRSDGAAIQSANRQRLLGYFFAWLIGRSGPTENHARLDGLDTVTQGLGSTKTVGGKGWTAAIAGIRCILDSFQEATIIE